MPHQWSGFPGAFCLKCGVENEMENALGLGWFTIPPPGKNKENEKWLSEDHRRLVELCDTYCEAVTLPEVMQRVREEVKQLKSKIKNAKNA